MNTLKNILMHRDGLSEQEAINLIAEMQLGIINCIDEGLDVEEYFMSEYGLEPDYLEILILSII